MSDEKRNIAVLGSTGSIGVTALRVIEAHPERYRIIALAAGKNLELLENQIHRFHPKAVSIQQEVSALDLRKRSPLPRGPKVHSGMEGLMALVTMEEVDTVISAMSGSVGLRPTFGAVKAGKDVALANKESMVMAGPLIIEEAKRQGAAVLPIDSEHSAILQSTQGHPREDIRRVILTASGGPFRGYPQERLRDVTPAEALKHPNWNMGPKVTIDSATLMNKGLEVIEAKWLFGLEMDQISILIHPQSIVHSMVEYRDGSIIAQLGIPDMTIPISYALSYPHHIEMSLPSLDLETIGTLSFEKPDTETFRCLDLASWAARVGGTMPVVLNSANEVAVEAFLERRLGFLGIADLVEKTMRAHEPAPLESLESVEEANRWARSKARELLSG